MVVLGLANNLFSGEIPYCWIKWQSLRVLRLDGNRVSGKIPISMGTVTKFQSLHLHNNRLHGEIPLSLKSCTNLVAINFGENELNGHIPGWMGHGRPNLIILILRSNKFGVVIKGQFLEYGNTLNLVRLVDLSRNNLSGEIPQEVVNLQALQTLNLSQNHLTGKIPKLIGAMILIETLDLSQNQLTGSIPESISGMTFLSHLNLSFNNLTGIIPTSTQLQSFNESCYAGNHLCGPPLKGCRGSGKETDVKNRAKGIGKGREINWFYVSMPLGFVTGFWCVLGPLVFNRRWRITYYRVLTELWWKVYDFVGKF
ncbi:hypothetical protein ES319_D10G143700v1 [Gossypium barbadense]|uniref:Leucine-rich repeat-containing N-terminal plant-type domain-containing protein n=1 Tax=Gossypium barbadense TaxID=3634 RepID=A0A5J5PRR9_GOSBA|nr:hypothetical protein ES319_D10G143700v1 [Gossypium barbadense]